MNPAEIHGLFERDQAIRSGHFKLSSGRHSDAYVQCALVLERPRVAASLAQELAARTSDGADVVVSPAMGGILIGYLVAYELGCRFVFTERADGAMTLRRGQRIRQGDRALVVEDVVTTGGSAAEVLRIIEAAGAKPLGVSALVDRTERHPGFHLEALLTVSAATWEPSECPMCARGDPLHTPGSRTLSNVPPAGPPSL